MRPDGVRRSIHSSFRPRPARPRSKGSAVVPKPVVLIAEELSPATIDALGPDFDVRQIDGTDRPALLAASCRRERRAGALGHQDRRRGDRGGAGAEGRRARGRRARQRRHQGRDDGGRHGRQRADLEHHLGRRAHDRAHPEPRPAHSGAHASLVARAVEAQRPTRAPSCSRRRSASSASAASARSSPSACTRSACAWSHTTRTSRRTRAQQLQVELLSFDELLRAERLHHRSTCPRRPRPPA